MLAREAILAYAHFLSIFALASVIAAEVTTVAYIRWGRAHAGDGPLELSVPEFGRIRGLLWLEVGLFIFIPLCATFMARGFH
jgi:uncharacterized membrane protein